MLDKIFLDSIKQLFIKKKYLEVISRVEENYDLNDRPPGLSNLCAISKILKPNITKDDIISALNDFEHCYRKSDINPLKVEALCNYITACVKNSQKYIEITKYFKKAKEMYQECEKEIGYNEKLFMHGVDLFKYSLDHKKNRKLLKELMNNNTKSKIIACAYSYMSNYTYDWDQKDYFEYSKKFKDFFPKYITKKTNEINYEKNKKIKIGFVSKDFAANHSITYFLKDTLKHLNQSKFETYGVSLTDDIFLKGSSLELKNNFDRWLNFTKLKNEEIINELQSHRIEILIDFMGLYHADRIEIFNSRVSPLQISWLGYPNTVGFPTIDYLVTDKNLIKKNEEKLYVEKTINLPNIWNCHSGFKFDREFTESPFKKNKYITFGSFNNFLKISDDVVEVWSKILKKVNHSKLILKSSLNLNNEFILEKFEEYGVHNSIEFYAKQDFLNVENHIKLYKEVDIALDTFPYNGVTTTFEALWSGVPVIVMKGYNMNSRCGESILINAKIESFLSSNKEEYVNKAVDLSNDRDKLEAERKNIFENILKSSLFDSKQFSTDFQNEIFKVYNRKLDN